MDSEKGSVQLHRDESGLALVGGGMTLRLDLGDMWRRVAPGKWEHELLAKAAKIRGEEGRPLRAIDATAGLGEDSMILAAAGYTVEMYEQDPVIAALLEDALLRAAGDPELSMLTQRMHLHKEDSIAALRRIGSWRQEAAADKTISPSGEDGMAQGVAPDLVYLDPMFPARTKSGLVGKKFQLLHELEAPASNEEELLRAAMEAHPQKIVIKRPRKGSCLAGIRPSYSLIGKAIRYDCIVLPPQNGHSKSAQNPSK